MNVKDFQKYKEQQKKISLVTCYDYVSARIIENSNIDGVLVGDSAAMVIHGFTNTTMATMDMMVMHTRAVAKGLKTKFLIADLPFLSYRKSLTDTIESVQRLIQAGAHAIKLEGAHTNIEVIQHIVESGVPVMGHIGLMGQAVHALGGHKVQGREEALANDLLTQAKALEKAGCFSIVLECIPAPLAKKITDILTIPTIGIGAGPDTSGQILVLHDLLGLQVELKPKFLKHFMTGHDLAAQALNQYVDEVRNQTYPNLEQHCY